LKAYEADKVAESPASGYVSSTTQDVSASTSQFANSPTSTAGTSLYGAQSPQSSTSAHTANQGFPNPASGYIDHSKPGYQPEMVPASSQSQAMGGHYMTSSLPQLDMQSMHYSLPGFDPHAAAGFVPTTTQGSSNWTSAPMMPGIIPGLTGSPDMNYDDLPYLASFGQEYSRYMHQSYPSTYQNQTLSQQQQMELMASLEQSQLPDVSNLVSDATTFYSAQLP
jgi:hypothetical protein